MAAFDLSKVVSLTVKANELHDKSHYERSLIKWRAALTAAEALGAEDCLLVAKCKTEVTRSSIACEAHKNVPFSQAFLLEMLELQASSAATLRRRRDAGTLMEGKCRPVETQWRFKYLDGVQESAVASVQLRTLAQLVGYDTFLNLCHGSMNLLSSAFANDAFEHGGETERAFLAFVCDLCDDTVELMIQPRVAASGTSMECALYTSLPELLDALGLDPEHRKWRERVAAALLRLRKSGALQKRGLKSVDVECLQTYLQESRDRADLERAAAAESGLLKSCALAGCGAKEAHVSQFGKCSACKAVAYCCRDHQQADWPAHKAACKAARKAAAAAKDAA